LTTDKDVLIFNLVKLLANQLTTFGDSMKRIISLLALFVLTVASSQAAVTSDQAYPHVNQPLIKLTYAYFPLAVPISVLGETMQRDRILKKNLAKYGVHLTFRPFAKGNDVLPLIRQGQIAGVSFADMPAIEAAVTGDMLIVGFVKQSYSAIVAASGTQISDLRNKRIGNAYGSTSHYALLQALSSAGLGDKNVTLIPMETSQMLESLENGTIDAFAAWEPTPSAAMKKYPGRFAQISRQISYSFFMLSGSLVHSNPDTAREITAALIRAIHWLNTSNTNLLKASRWAQAGVKNFTGKPSLLHESDIARITRSDLLDIASAPAIPQKITGSDSLLFKEFELLKQVGKLPADASRQKLEKSFSNKLVHEVHRASARYGLNRYDYAN
jgi:NitT/TauT family transport system substrate-binding protein